MSRDEFTLKPRRFFGRLNLGNSAKGFGLIAAVFIYATIPLAAPHIFGTRGSLLGWLIEWLILFLLFAALLGFTLRLSWPPTPSRSPKWLYAVLTFLIGISVLAGGATFRDAADMVLPFNQKQIMIARTYYDPPQDGRGQVPENGGWHVITSDG